jgi:hypothetical protein
MGLLIRWSIDDYFKQIDKDKISPEEKYIFDPVILKFSRELREPNKKS